MYWFHRLIFQMLAVLNYNICVFLSFFSRLFFYDFRVRTALSLLWKNAYCLLRLKNSLCDFSKRFFVSSFSKADYNFLTDDLFINSFTNPHYNLPKFEFRFDEIARSREFSNRIYLCLFFMQFTTIFYFVLILDNYFRNQNANNADL